MHATPGGRTVGPRGLVVLLALLLGVAACAVARDAPRPSPWAGEGPEQTPPPTAAQEGHPGPCPTSSPSGADRVIIVSLDGLSPDALLQAHTPNLGFLWREGSYTLRAQTVLPSLTLPAHASMLSGLDVPGHRITWNDWQPERGYLQVPTVFTIAKGAGLKVAAFVGKAKLRHLAPPGSVDQFEVAGFWARDIVPKALDYLLRERPQLFFLHLPDPDSAGHAAGWLSPAQLEAVARTDEALGILFEGLRRAGLWEGTFFIVTADHGGHDGTHGSADPRDTTIPWIAYGPGVRRGVELQGPVRVFDTAATALWALDLSSGEGWDGHPILEALDMSAPDCPAAVPARQRGP